jgi:cytoskeletal protein CcmA (bactofilin family)
MLKGFGGASSQRGIPGSFSSMSLIGGVDCSKGLTPDLTVRGGARIKKRLCVGGNTKLDGKLSTQSVTVNGDATFLGNVYGLPQTVNVDNWSGGDTGFNPSSLTNGNIVLSGILNLSNGGTGLSTVGSPGQLLGVDVSGNLLEYKDDINLSGGAIFAGDIVAGNGNITGKMSADELCVFGDTSFFGNVFFSGNLESGVSSISGGTTGLTPNFPTMGHIVLSGILNPNSGGTGLSSLGTSDQILGMNVGGTALEYKDNLLLTGATFGNVSVTGELTGNVVGDLTGDVVGDLTGDVVGDLTGNVVGDLTGDVVGDLTGNVVGDLTGDVIGDLTGNITGDICGNITTQHIIAKDSNNPIFIDGNVQLAGTLQVQYGVTTTNVSGDVLNLTQDAFIGNSLTVANKITTGNLCIQEDVDIAGKTFMKDVCVDENLQVSGDVQFDNNANVDGDLIVNGDLCANNSEFKGNSIFNGPIIDGNLISGNVGDILTSTGTGVQWSTGSGGGGITSVSGTANQITSNGVTSIILSTPNEFIAPGSIAATTTFQDGTTDNIAGAGAGSQANATQLTTSFNIVTSVSFFGGVRLPTPTPGMRVTIINRASSACIVYGQSGCSIDDLSVNTGHRMPVNSITTLEARTTTQWFSVVPITIASTRTALGGNGNTVFGPNSLTTVNNSATNNSVFGASAMRSATSNEAFNVAIGPDSLGRMSAAFGGGDYNIAIGYRAGYNLSGSVSRNICIGSETLGGGGATNGPYDNIIIGHQTCQMNGGSFNVCIGSNTSSGGSNNFFFSTLIGEGITLGSNTGSNTVIGADASISTNVTNATAIGRPGLGLTINRTGGFFCSIPSVGTTGSNVNYLPASRELIVPVSSQRFKTNIRDLENVSNNFKNLRPVRYNPKTNLDKEEIGLIAEELNEIFPEFVIRDEEGEILTINYERLVPVLIKEMQTQSKEIKMIQDEINSLKKA